MKKPDECDTAKFFDTMISDGIIVDARADTYIRLASSDRPSLALLLSGLEQSVDHAAERGMPLSDEHLAQFYRNISTITHLTAASSDRPMSYSICHKP